MTFSGNYTAYAQKKEQYRLTKMRAYFNQQREIKHQQEVIGKLRSFNREKSIKRAESREKLLDKIEVLEKPSEVKNDMHIALTPGVISGKDVLGIEELSKAFEKEVLFRKVSFSIKRGEHVAIIGDNGAGKTTLLKLINGLLSADEGTIKLGMNVHIGYYDQEHHVLHTEKTVYDEIADTYPALTTTAIRNILAAFLFTGDDVFKLVGECSGGERGRISLAKLMLSEANFLILDEPTNHLDIASKEILEDALNRYEGTVLYVSHDRYFINRTAHRILELNAQTLVGYLGNYDYYLEKKTADTAVTQKKEADIPAVSSAKADWQVKKAAQAKKRKLESDLKKTETRIAELEGNIAEIDAEMASDEVCRNSVRLGELSAEQNVLRGELEQLYAVWEKLSEGLL